MFSNKKKVALITIFLSFILFGCFITQIIKISNKHRDLNLSMNDVEKLELDKDSKAIFKNFQQNSTYSKVLIAFNPDCEHCQQEAIDVYEHRSDLKNVYLFFVANSKSKDISDFAEKFKLKNLKNVNLVKDTKNILADSFGVKSIPTIFIYNKDNQLIKRFDGETKIDAILKYVSPEYSSAAK